MIYNYEYVFDLLYNKILYNFKYYSIEYILRAVWNNIFDIVYIYTKYE